MRNTRNNTPILDPDIAAFIQRQVSINLATTDATNRPAVTRVFGCRVADDHRSLTLFISGLHNRQVLDNLQANGNIAVVFSRPSTHRTIQLKGRDATPVTIGEADRELIRAYRDSMAEELLSVGFPASFTRSMIPPPDAVDTGIRFTPLEAYSQTPGPRAGRKLSE